MRLCKARLSLRSVIAEALLMSLCLCSNSWICRRATPEDSASSDCDNPQFNRLVFNLVAWHDCILYTKKKCSKEERPSHGKVTVFFVI